MLAVLEASLQGEPLSREQFRGRFPDDATCLEAMMQSDFGGTTLACPRCAVTARFHAMSKRRAYACQACGHHIYPCAGTVFHGTRTPLPSWFFALHIMACAQDTVAAAELERRIGCTYKTALRMTRAFRKLSQGRSGGFTLAPQRRHTRKTNAEQRQA
jgi:hypothetical protein